jgi:CMP-N-acetylneuraminate monooxygenase
LNDLGLRNVRAVPFLTWPPVAPGARVMILRDGTERDDSGLLVEVAGRRILNTVDCSNINNGQLPEVDLLMSNFAGGASGYPTCWGRLYSQKWIEKRVESNRRSLARAKVSLVGQTKARWFMPFAGYFTEAHPADAEIRQLNVKNTPEEVCDLIRATHPQTRFWVPQPGDVFDLATEQVVSPAVPPVPPTYAFASHGARLRNVLTFEPLQHLDGVLEYFRWAGYRGDLILHLIETDEDFTTTIREYLLDLTGPRLLAQRPAGAHRYLQMRVRADAFRYVLWKGLPWEELSIGFQARFYREPDVYNFDFWDHFQNNLPPVPLWQAHPPAASSRAA